MNDYTKLPKLSVIFENKLNLTAIENSINSSQVTKGYSPNKDQYGLFYYESTQVVTKIVKSLLPENLSKCGEVSFCRIIGGIVPHKDHDCKSKINIYLRATAGQTIFFDDPGKPGTSFHGDDRHNIYDYKKDNLRVSSRFVARDNDVYLLDTSRIHCVILPPTEYRIIVSISFTESYAKIFGNLV